MDGRQEHKYENVDLEEQDRSSRSSTEVESLMGEEKPWHAEGLPLGGGRRGRRGASPPSRTSRAVAAARSCRWLVDTLLLLAILGLVLRQQLRAAPRNPHDIGGDITGVGPRFPQQITTFAMDYKYAPNNVSEFFTDGVLQAWNDLMPRGMGFQHVREPERYHDLPAPIEWPDKTVFTTSVTHQVHCLFAIVQTYSGLKAGHELPSDHHWHMIHCFSYLRQAILCAADTALEGHETTFPDHNGGSDGWDSKHVCRDYGEVKKYLESVRAYDDQLIY